MVVLDVEVAESPQARAQGLMFRRSMESGTGMLFLFDEPGQQSFWMLNTYIPLSIAFIDEDWEITQISEMTPLDSASVVSVLPAVAAVEVPSGWFDMNGVGLGDKVVFDRTSSRVTFGIEKAASTGGLHVEVFNESPTLDEQTYQRNRRLVRRVEDAALFVHGRLPNSLAAFFGGRNLTIYVMPDDSPVVGGGYWNNGNEVHISLGERSRDDDIKATLAHEFWHLYSHVTGFWDKASALGEQARKLVEAIPYHRKQELERLVRARWGNSFGAFDDKGIDEMFADALANLVLGRPASWERIEDITDNAMENFIYEKVAQLGVEYHEYSGAGEFVSSPEFQDLGGELLYHNWRRCWWFVTAVVGDGAVGVAMGLGVDDDTYEMAPAIVAIMVEPEHQHKGIGGELQRRLIDMAKADADFSDFPFDYVFLADVQNESWARSQGAHIDDKGRWVLPLNNGRVGSSGLRRSIKSPLTETTVGIYRAEDAHLDDAGGRWALICEEHGTYINVGTMKDAVEWAAHPEDWCEVCQSQEKTAANLNDAFEDRLGNCFELAFKYALDIEMDSDKSDVRLVHGSIQGGGNPRIAHAWVEFTDESLATQIAEKMRVPVDIATKNAWMAHDPVAGQTFPTEAYNALFSARQEYRYAVREAMSRASSSRNFGPWDSLQYAYNKLSNDRVAATTVYYVNGDRYETYEQQQSALRSLGVKGGTPRGEQDGVKWWFRTVQRDAIDVRDWKLVYGSEL